MKALKKFDLSIQQIMEQIQTYNDKPGFPGGNNIKHTDTGSQTGNTCKFATDPGNIGGKSDTCHGLCDEDIADSYRYQINQSIFVYSISSNIKNDEFINEPNIRLGIIESRKKFNGTNFYGIRFLNNSVLFSFPEFKLGLTPAEAKQNYYSAKTQIEQDGECAGIGTVNVMGPTPGMPSIADTAGGSRSAQKVVTDPGVTTKDVSQIYSPSLNKAPKAQKQRKQKFPLFSRLK